MPIISIFDRDTVKRSFMNKIEHTSFSGERPLFNSHDLTLENVTINLGESALKECSNINAYNSCFKGKYPFWHVNIFNIKNCVFEETARAALWYSHNLLMQDTLVKAPKMFRKMQNLTLRNIKLTNALETLWDCENIVIDNCEVHNGDYIFMNSKNISIKNLNLQGNYSFQGCKNVTITNSTLLSKDAFWESENITVIDSVIDGEYLGWHSRNLHLINCKISGSQPLCYAHDLTLDNCTFTEDANLAFEYCDNINATVTSPMTSVKNPTSGIIRVKSIGELILDKNQKAPASCKIITEDNEYGF